MCWLILTNVIGILPHFDRPLFSRSTRCNSPPFFGGSSSVSSQCSLASGAKPALTLRSLACGAPLPRDLVYHCVGRSSDLAGHAWSIATGNLALSEQQLVDRDVVDSGCNGELMHRKVPRARRSITLTAQPMPIADERDQLSFQSYSSGVLTASCGMKLTTEMDESALDVVVTAWCPTQKSFPCAGW